MTHIDLCITKGAKADDIEIRRAKGPASRFSFPKKGPIPHDAVHLFVETTMGLTRGFWGLVLEGQQPEAIQEMAKAAGHASASRARAPDSTIVELLQAERLVECFEAELWSGGADDAALLDLAATACAASHVPLPPIASGALARARGGLADFARVWRAAGEGHVARFEWKD